jgi:hypothetical protein
MCKPVFHLLSGIRAVDTSLYYRPELEAILAASSAVVVTAIKRGGPERSLQKCPSSLSRSSLVSPRLWFQARDAPKPHLLISIQQAPSALRRPHLYACSRDAGRHAALRTLSSEDLEIVAVVGQHSIPQPLTTGRFPSSTGDALEDP